MSAKTFFALFLLCLSSTLPLPVMAEEKDDASAFANDLGHQALGIITDTSVPKQEKRARLEALFQKNVDIDWIGKFVLGRNWRDATEDQQKRYLENYKAFLIKHYTSNLTEFTDANFQVTKVTPEDTGGNVVTMRMKRPNAEDVIVDYTIRKKDGDGLKVYDITVEGVSLITTQRSEFASVVSQKGIDYLIDQLAARSKEEEKDKSVQ